MECAAVDSFSYGQVTVTGTSLTVALKDIKGETVREGGAGNPTCGPYTLQAK